MTEEQVERGSIMAKTKVERGKHLLYFRPGIGVLKLFSRLSSQTVLWAMHRMEKNGRNQDAASTTELDGERRNQRCIAYPWSIIRPVAEA